MSWHGRTASIGLASLLVGACAGGEQQAPYAPPSLPADSDSGGGNNAYDSGGWQQDAPSSLWPEASSDDAGGDDAGGDDAPGTGDDVSNPGDDASVSEGGPAPATCLVTFTVHGIAWPAADGGDAGGSSADAGAGAVYVVGSDSRLGGTIPTWTITAGLKLTQESAAPDTWTGSIDLTDQELIIFKFVEVSPENPMGWESLGGPFTDRQLRIDCSLEGGAPDAGSQPAGPDGGSPAVGVSYEGTFGVRPPDANGP